MRIRARNATRHGRAALLRLAGAGLAAALLAAFAAAPAGAVGGVKEFYVHFAGNPTFSCALYDGYQGGHEALCEYTAGHTQAKATLRGDGSVTLCRSGSVAANRCELGDAGMGSPTLGPGKTVRVGRFTCSVQRRAVRCTVTATGEGFLFGPKVSRAVGGATVEQR